MIMVIRRSSRSAIAPASGPKSSAGSSVTIQTPLTAAAPVPFPESEGASAVSATMDSQSPRLDSDRAVHSRRNGLTDRAPPPREGPAGLEAAGGPKALRPRRLPVSRCGAARKFTALAYRQIWPFERVWKQIVISGGRPVRRGGARGPGAPYFRVFLPAERVVADVPRPREGR